MGHYKTLCKGCESIISECGCFSNFKTTKYEMCGDCGVVIHPPVAFTDMPFSELGDPPSTPAPIRQVEVLAYDGDKYATVRTDGHILEVKVGYLYAIPGRCNNVDNFCLDALRELPTEFHEDLHPVNPGTLTPKDIDEYMSDWVGKILYYDRKDDEELPLGKLEEDFRAGGFTLDDICESFRSHMSVQLAP